VSSLFWVSYVLLWILVSVLVIGVLALYHHFGQIYLMSRENRDAQGPAEGSALRAMESEGLAGEPVVLPLDKPTLVVFTATTCNICQQVRTGIPLVRAEHPEVEIIVICEGRPSMVRAWAGELIGVVPIMADPRARLTARYEVDNVPFCIAVGSDGLVRSRGLVNGYAGLLDAVHDATALPLVPVGDERAQP
jgi:hypothetical protein